MDSILPHGLYSIHLVQRHYFPDNDSVQLGSVLGPILFIAYSAEVINIVEYHGLQAHAFADDLQVYGHVAQDDPSALVVRMVACIEHVKKAWMRSIAYVLTR